MTGITVVFASLKSVVHTALRSYMCGATFVEAAALPTCRDTCFRGNPTALAASPAARAASDGLHALVHNYHDPPMARIRHHTQVLDQVIECLKVLPCPV